MIYDDNNHNDHNDDDYDDDDDDDDRSLSTSSEWLAGVSLKTSSHCWLSAMILNDM